MFTLEECDRDLDTRRKFIKILKILFLQIVIIAEQYNDYLQLLKYIFHMNFV